MGDRPDADATERDGELLQRIAGGDRQALADLYAAHRLPLFHYLLHLTPDRGIAEELLQDTLVAVWRNAAGYAGHASVKAWLFGIARRRAYKRLRRRDPDTAGLEALEELPAADPDPEAALLARVEREAVLAALDRLTEVHREVVLLAFAQELSYAEIAEVLSVPLGTVKSRLSNARRALRELLRPDTPGEERD